MKLCYRCKADKPDSEFYTGSRGKLMNKCKTCTIAAATASRQRIAAGISLQPPPFMRAKRGQVTERQVAAMLNYDPKTGAFTWKVGRGRIHSGSPAGSVSKKGYLHISICGCVFKAHRLAWFLITGSWPAQTIKHKNGVKADNRFENLEDVSVSENSKHGHRTGLINSNRPRVNGRWAATIAKESP